jgi:hypothetical protein
MNIIINNQKLLIEVEEKKILFYQCKEKLYSLIIITAHPNFE